MSKTFWRNQRIWTLLNRISNSIKTVMFLRPIFLLSNRLSIENDLVKLSIDRQCPESRINQGTTLRCTWRSRLRSAKTFPCLLSSPDFRSRRAVHINPHLRLFHPLCFLRAAFRPFFPSHRTSDTFLHPLLKIIANVAKMSSNLGHYRRERCHKI